ncbi:hypothetical protein HLV40_15145 [Chromohalobacter salexigens]|nr:hypothetical protein [Chromohalobacter salexigens]
MSYPNMRLIIDNVHDAASLTATSEALPVDYTQRSGRSYVWRSTDTAEQIIEATLSGTQYIDAIVLYRHNLSASATVRVELLNGGSVVYDSGASAVAELITPPSLRVGIDPWGATYNDAIPVALTMFWLPITAVTGYRITIDDPANPDGFIQVGRIISGLSFSPRYNPAYGVQLTWQEGAENRRTEAGSLRTITSNSKARLLNIDLNHLPNSDRVTLTTELVKRGMGSDVFVSLYPEQGGVKEIEHAFLAKRNSDFSSTHDFYANWQSTIPFLEV